MPTSNRLPEFLSAVEAARIKAASSIPEHKQPFLSSADKQASRSNARSEFAKAALAISKDIQSTTAKLEKLAQRMDSSNTHP